MLLVHMASGFDPLDANSVLATTGVVGIFLTLVAETGLLIGFFLPGNSLLFAAGLLAATHGRIHLPLAGVLVAAATGATIGAQIGYWLGRTAGSRLLARTRRPALQRGVERTRVVLDRYGPAKAIVLARFIPVVRTVMNPLAGVLRVPLRTFVGWQVAGGLVWSIGVVLAGYWLGRRIPGIDTYLLPIVAGIVVLSVLPIGLEILRRRARDRPGSRRDSRPSLAGRQDGRA